jgi:hypothetical protein
MYTSILRFITQDISTIKDLGRRTYLVEVGERRFRALVYTLLFINMSARLFYLSQTWASGKGNPVLPR